MKPAGMATNSPHSSNVIHGDNPVWMHLDHCKTTKPSRMHAKQQSKGAAMATGIAGDCPSWMTETKNVNVRPAVGIAGANRGVKTVKSKIADADRGPSMSDQRKNMHYYPDSDISQMYAPKRNPWKQTYDSRMKDISKQFLLGKGYTVENLSKPGMGMLFRDEIHPMEFATIFGRDTLTPTRRFGFRSPRQLVKEGEKKVFGKKRFQQHLRCSPRGAAMNMEHYGQGHGLTGGRGDEAHGVPISLWQMKGSPVKNTRLTSERGGFGQLAHGRKFISHGSTVKFG